MLSSLAAVMPFSQAYPSQNADGPGRGDNNSAFYARTGLVALAITGAPGIEADYFCPKSLGEVSLSPDMEAVKPAVADKLWELALTVASIGSTPSRSFCKISSARMAFCAELNPNALPDSPKGGTEANACAAPRETKPDPLATGRDLLDGTMGSDGIALVGTDRSCPKSSAKFTA